MKTIGTLIKEAREHRNISLRELEKQTKIKSSFIEAIEKEAWETLPTFSVVLGFVKSIASVLLIDEKLAVAVLKRDYPPQKFRVTPKPDVSNGKFVWSPRFTFVAGIALVLFVLFGYLGFQYIHFISPPRLQVESPQENQVVIGGSINVFGSTDTDAKVTVNDQPVTVSDDGKFSISLDIVAETREIKIVASSRSGKTTTVSRKITVQ